MAKFEKACHDFRKVADFIIVYLEEAHPIDEALIKGFFHIKEHKSLKDRSAAVDELKDFAPNLPCKVYMDSMKNEGLINYGSYPERLYIIQNGIVKFIGGIGPFDYSVDEMTARLRTLV